MKKNTPVLEFLGILCIFSVFLDKAIRGAFAFDFYYYYPIFFIFLLALVMKKGHFALPPRWLNGACMLIFSVSAVVLWLNNRLGLEFIKQAFGIVFTTVVYYNVLYVFQFRILLIFNHYLRFAYWVALFGVVDNILHSVGIHLTHTFRSGPIFYRELSIMGEPFYLALALTPAIVYYLIFFQETWKQNRIRFLIIFLCYLVTFSSIALTGLGVGIVLSLYFNNFFSVGKNKFVLIPLIVIPLFIGFNLLIDNVKLFKARFTDTTNLFLTTELKTREAGKANASTFALYSNFIIARDSFLENPLWGSGLGAHPLIYDETFIKHFPRIYLRRFGAYNKQDANSKFLRLMSETGLLGIALFLAGFFGFFVKKRYLITPELQKYGAINYSIFVYILLCLIRNGNYINIGFFFFFFIYYFTHRFVKDSYFNKVALPDSIYTE